MSPEGSARKSACGALRSFHVRRGFLAKERPDAVDVLRGVNRNAVVLRYACLDPDSFFDHAKLFELFDFLKPGGRPGREFKEEVAPVRVEPDMLVVDPAGRGEAIRACAIMGDGRNGKINRPSVGIRYRLDDARVDHV